jgi:hypothetical protein
MHITEKSVKVRGMVQVPFATITELESAELGPPRPRVTLGTLPDDVLLEISDLYLNEAEDLSEWHTLVHVCSRWRNVVFSSPHRLDLRLDCSVASSANRVKMLGIWPALPIYISLGGTVTNPDADENVIAALQQHDRVCAIDLDCISNPQFEKFVVAMQEPFPELIYMNLKLDLRPSDEDPTPISPESFLAGFAPRLRHLRLDGIPFPQLQKFLVSASCSNIVQLRMVAIPHSGYIRPETMVTCLSSLSRLESFKLGFRSPQSRPNRERTHPPHLTRTVLPTLTSLAFGGSSEYLEDLVSRIDVPLLSVLKIQFFHQLIFDHPHLARFISRAEKLRTLSQVEMIFSLKVVWASFTSPTGTLAANRPKPKLEFEISCSGSDWQTSSVEQVCKSTLPSLSNIERLYITEYRHWSGYRENWPDDMEYPQLPYDMDSSQWLELFLPFATVKDLYLSKEFAQRIASALQELAGESATEVLPALQNLSVEGLQSSGSEEAIEKFVAVRQLANRRVVIHNWERERSDTGDDDVW